MEQVKAFVSKPQGPEFRSPVLTSNARHSITHLRFQLREAEVGGSRDWMASLANQYK